MNTRFSIFIFLFLSTAAPDFFPQQKFYLDFNNRDDDIFTVTLLPEKLSDENNVYQFASTAPGTYERMDIGRFVKSFTAYDENGNEIETNQKSLNQWSINEPEKVSKIVYQVEDTWDTPVDSNFIYPMCGSSVDTNYVLINGQCVFGYFHGMQAEPIEVKIDYPNNWLLGTALQLNDDGYYEAKDYDQIVDSPILLGMLTKASTTISDAKIDVYTFSKTGLLKSQDILSSIEDILEAEDAFTEGLPVDHYTFLFHFEDLSFGAWEHMYSSIYVFKEDPLTELMDLDFSGIIAHEFFHIVTPLNIHSELVERFNFEKPVMSQHLWLYEGTTEWAAYILLLRDSLISLNDYLNVLHKKLSHAEGFDKKISLTHLAIHSTEMMDQYQNIYQKGAIIAGLLDIRLLELSGGTRGLREVINELAEKYGPDNSFNEETFFDDFVAMTYPGIRNFIEKYIKGTASLPIKEYYGKLGINYLEEDAPDTSHVSLGVQINFDGTKFIISQIDENSPNFSSLKAGDIIYKIEGEEITIENVQEKFAQLRTNKKVGDTVNMTVLRHVSTSSSEGDDNTEVNLTLQLTAQKNKHILSVNENATAEQVALRNIWIGNL
jgi:predicted metalloprotease with PDZ domain